MQFFPCYDSFPKCLFEHVPDLIFILVYCRAVKRSEPNVPIPMQGISSPVYNFRFGTIAGSIRSFIAVPLPFFSYFSITTPFFKITLAYSADSLVVTTAYAFFARL